MLHYEIQGISKETFSGFGNGNSCFVAFSPATHMQPLKQTAQAAAELDRKYIHKIWEGFFKLFPVEFYTYCERNG